MKPSRRRRFAIASAGMLLLGLPLLFAQVSRAPPPGRGPVRPGPPGPSAAPLDLNGYWTYQDKAGSATVQIVHTVGTNKFEAIFKRGEPCAEHDGQRDFYIKGKFDPVKVKIEGYMKRCTINAELHNDCPELELWATKYTADGDIDETSDQSVVVTSFSGTYEGQHYDKDSNGKYICVSTEQKESFILKRVREPVLPGAPAPAPPGPLPGEAPAPPSANPFKQVWDSIWGNANVDEKIWDRKHDGPEGSGQ